MFFISFSLFFQGTNADAMAEELDNEGVWTKRAAMAQDSLQSNFWNAETNLFNNKYPCQNCNDQFHYWWLAHAIDTLVDGYERTNNDEYLHKATALFNSIVEKNGGITNQFYDDMLWMGLALLRLNEYKDDPEIESAVFTLWEDIKQGWNNEMGGGIAWNKSQLDYKNTPSNAPAVILASRLYQKYDNPDDLEWAKKIYDWQRSILVDPQTGFVWDGINRTGDGNIDKNWEFTYNQGVYIGASVELYRITEEAKYIEAALQTAETAIDRLADPITNVLNEQGGGDGGLFKGIFIRYLGDLIEEEPQQRYLAQFILDNAESAWELTKSEDKILFGASWKRAPELEIELSQQLSGVMLMEQASMIENASPPQSLSLLNDMIEQFETEGEIPSDQAAHSLKLHLTAVRHFEQQEAVEKVVKHLENFKELLNYQKEQELISNKAHRLLQATTNDLIEQFADLLKSR